VSYVELARAESERGEVVLRARQEDEAPAVLELRVNGVFVMDTAETRSERALATTALARVDAPRTVLVGGLGLGFTVHEVLADRRVEHVVVAELEPALVGWMRDGTVPHGPAFLADERVRVVAADVRQVVAEAAPSSYDLVLLDVDNGPGHLVFRCNADVYRPAFLRDTARALRPGGAVAVWSAGKAPELAEAMSEVLGEPTPMPFEVQLQGRPETYWLYLAHRDG
jgi:spermidine synthase